MIFFLFLLQKRISNHFVTYSVLLKKQQEAFPYCPPAKKYANSMKAHHKSYTLIELAYRQSQKFLKISNQPTLRHNLLGYVAATIFFCFCCRLLLQLFLHQPFYEPPFQDVLF